MKVALSQMIFAAAAIVTLAASSLACAQENFRLAEQEIKAGLVYNFLKYTERSPSARDADVLLVCLFGRDPLDGRLMPMAGRTVNKRAIAVRNVAAGEPLDSCALVFIAEDQKARWPMIRAELTNKAVLTVGDFRGFAASGGMIEFAKVNDRIAIRLNTPAVSAAGLTVQDRILQLASIAK